MAQQQGQQPYPPTIQPPAHHHYPPQHHPHHHLPYIPPPHPHPPYQTTYPYAQQYSHTPHQYGPIPGPTMPPMAHHHHHHQYPPSLPPYYSGSGSGSGRTTSKRPREPPSVSDPELGPSTKRQAVGNDVLFRVLVPAAQIGKVIGKGGHRVQKVRDDTNATVKIADPIARYEERVIIISSKANDGAVTDAEKALLQIVSLILADDGTSAASQTLNLYAGDVPANSVKLLIAGSQAGGLIGVSGQNIDKLRSSSGATITVLSPNQLPMCASAQESDRLVQISGEVSSVIKAVEDIGTELRANPPSEVISISPTYNLSIARVAQSYMDPNAAEYVTLDMVISETMVGGLIGRSGSNIARIRSESGAMIKVIGGKGEQKHRQIQLIGTAQQVAFAKQRVDEYIYSQLTQ